MGTHPIFESDFDCLTEWVAVEADLDHAKRSLEKNREEVDLEVESVNEVEIVKIDRDQGIGIEKIVIVIAIDEAAVVIVNEMIKDHLQKVPERIQFVGSKSLQNQDNHLLEKHHLEKLLYYSERMLFQKLQIETYRSWSPLNGQCWSKYQRVTIFPVHCQNPLVGFKARRFRACPRRYGSGPIDGKRWH